MTIKAQHLKNYKNSTLRIATGFTLAFIFHTLFFYCPPITLSIVLTIAMFIMIAELKNMVKNNIIFYCLAPFYPILPSLILIYFNQTPIYKNLLLYLFIIVFSFDSASYFFGKLWSKLWTTNKIIPSVSPGKSWQGAFGGYAFTTFIISISVNPWYTYNISFLLLLSGIICTIAFCGDIFESYLKRSAKLKDSGNLLPGHGGLLDRFDAVLVVSFLFFAYKDTLLYIFQ